MADPDIVPTDLVQVLSSLHGRERRQQRNIKKRDLQAAVKYGKKEPALVNRRGEQRWKYTFADIVYITDSTSTREVTSWPVQACGLDLTKVKITPAMQKDHDRATEALQNKSTWTSHTVVIVDQSGSMRTADAAQDATRADLVWLVLALNVVAEKLKNGERNQSDVFSLVTMRLEGKAVLQMQPFDWILFNGLIDLLRTSEPLGCGNYIPAFDLAEELLTRNTFGRCTLFLLILSDGRPSDKIEKGRLEGSNMSSVEMLTNIVRDRIGNLACRFGRRLTVGAVALGKPGYDDFSTLHAVADEAREYGSMGVFQSASLSAGAVSAAMSKMTSLVTSTMMETKDVGNNLPVRQFLKEKLSSIGGKTLTNDWDYVAMACQTRNGRVHRSIVRTRWVKDEGWTACRAFETFSCRDAIGIAFKKRWFGEGRERLVKEFREVDKNRSFVGPPMVAKDSRFVRPKNATDEKEFHKVFCRAQQLAQKLARTFNGKLMGLPNVNSFTTPIIEFLECCVYMIDHPVTGRHGYLVERMLDIKKFKYQKWNDNAGNIGEEKQACHSIEEVDDDDVSSTDTSYNDDISFSADDIPQAFSCFTYRYSHRQLLVCDLQGILNTDRCPPVFELTDPVIHYKSNQKRKCVYGRTDRGAEGIGDFYKTHKCSNLCRMLQRHLIEETPNAVAFNDT